MNKSFEDQWKDALGDASQTPPPEIWERVEAELNRKKSRFLLWKNPVWMDPARRGPVILSGVAAAVTLVLGTLFFINYTAPERGVSQKAGRPAVTQEPEGRSSEQDVTSSRAVSAEKEYEQSVSRPVIPASIVPGQAQEEQASRTVHTLAMNRVSYAKGNEVQTSAPEYALSADGMNRTKGNALAAAYDPLAPLPYGEMQAHAEYPQVQAEMGYAPINRESKKEKKGWMGVIAANAPFNPNFSTPGFQRQAMMAVQNSNAFLSFDKGSPALGDSFYSNSSRTDAQSSFNRGQSMSFGVMFGRKLKKKLSLESGLKFTRATATHTSNVYAVNTETGETESFSYANYVSSSNKMSDVLISVNGTSHYSYHFLSVPLLLNYEVLNIGKLNVNAVGGVSSEFLLSGTMVNSKQNEQSFNAGNSNFRPVNIAGAGGLRISYPLTSLLDINLGGMYQHFLTSGLQKNTDATFRPSMLGINLGLSVRQ